MKRPPYENFPVISNERLSLREIQSDDMKDLIEISFYDAIQATTMEQATEMQTRINEDYLSGNSIHWGIADRFTNRIVGTFDKGEGELGCVLLSKYKGQGYMTSAMSLAIDFGINEIGLSRIWAITTKQNQKAINLMEKLNFLQIAELEDDNVEYELKM